MASGNDASAGGVFNQSPVFENFNLYSGDNALRDAVVREGAGWADKDLTALGARFGRADTVEHSRLANEFQPVLKTVDAKGNRVERVDYHPSYHAMMNTSFGAGLHASSWDYLGESDEPERGACVARGAGFFLAAQAEAGHCCPVTMTHAAVPALLQQPELAEKWIPLILSRIYDPDPKPVSEKVGVTVGMGMTERQGGTDVRTNMSRAQPAAGGGPGAEYRLRGHKWFMSAPMCDAFLMLAQAPGGLSCFLVPRLRDDGSVNGLRLQRLKSKVGNRSNASSEVEFAAAAGWLIGDEGRGVPNIIEMATYTRADCALSSAGMMRSALAQALHHCAHRTVFQKRLVDQPLMRAVLADMAVMSEAATALVIRLMRAYDHARPRKKADEKEAAYKRIMTPAIKYWVCKTAPGFVCEAMETLGGNGYVEDGPMGRIYREMPLNSIWEGSGNVMCLDVLRAMSKNPADLDSVFEELGGAAKGSKSLSAGLDALKAMASDTGSLESRARLFVELLVSVAAGCLLLEHAPDPVSDSFLTTRPGGQSGRLYGTRANAMDAAAILDRAMPVH